MHGLVLLLIIIVGVLVGGWMGFDLIAFVYSRSGKKGDAMDEI